MRNDELIIIDEISHIEVAGVHMQVPARLDGVRCDADRALIVDKDLDGALHLDCIYPHQTNHDFLAGDGFRLTEHAAIAAILELGDLCGAQVWL